MASLIVLPQATDAFSAYRPSKNAHTDILTPASEASSSTAVKLSIPKAAVPPVSNSKQLEVLLSSMAPILAGQPLKVPFHTVADYCRNQVLMPSADSEQLFKNIDKELATCTERLARECRGAIMSREGNWLQRLVTTWEVYSERVGLLSSVFVYLDRVCAKEGSGVASIHERATEQFRETVWKNELLFENTRDDILAWATKEREDGKPDPAQRPVVRSVINVSRTLGTYISLAKPYIDRLWEVYKTLAESHVADIEEGKYTGTKYIQWTVDKEEEERERAAECFGQSAATEAVDAIHHVTGEKLADRVVRKALDEALYRSDMDALNRLFTFCKQAKAFNVFTKSMQAHIEARIRSVICDPENDRQMIDSTLKLKRFVDKAVASLFATPVKPIMANTDATDTAMDVDEDDHNLTVEERNRQLELEDAVRSGFKAGFSSRQNAPAEWIAKHLDSTMRKGQGTLTEAEFNTLLDEIVALVGYTPDKDVFRAFYARGLSKRLLLSKSASNDTETSMVVKLKKEMGDEFTTGDVMMQDLQTSEDLVQKYHDDCAKNASEAKERGQLSVAILTEGKWPQYELLQDGWDFKLSPALQSSLNSFTTWYSTQHQNRTLSWRHQLASVTLTAWFPSGKYEIGVSLFQAVVLLLFNDEDVLDFTEIKARTGIETSELVRTLQSLALGRKGTRVLVKRPAGKEVEPTDKFAANKAFTSERIKFRINQIQQEVSAEESRATTEQVAVDRGLVLEATIVRIMKARKRLTLQLLIDAVVSDVSKRFPPEVKDIKKRMESLIDREFLRRDDADRNTLHYVA